LYKYGLARGANVVMTIEHAAYDFGYHLYDFLDRSSKARLTGTYRTDLRGVNADELFQCLGAVKMFQWFRRDRNVMVNDENVALRVFEKEAKKGWEAWRRSRPSGGGLGGPGRVRRA
jgi:hypothetical protein